MKTFATLRILGLQAAHRPRLLPLAALCAAALAGPAAAQTAPAADGAPAVRQMCGGIGSDESERLRADMKNHPLSLLFARTGGDYLADVQVRLEDAAGKPVLAWKADGPVCLVDLPPGRYRVEARAGDTVRSQPVTVGTTPARLDFRF